MAKPILVVRIPFLEGKMTQEYLEKHQIPIEGIKDEYHVLFVIDEITQSVVFECYNADKCDDANLEDLKERLTIFMESALYRLKNQNSNPYGNPSDILNKQQLDRYYKMQKLTGIAPTTSKNPFK